MATPVQIPSETVEKWQGIVDLLAEIMHVPAALVMRVEPPNIKVFVSSESKGNPYEPDEVASLNTGLYCEAVMKTRQSLLVPDALVDEEWKSNPDIKLGMISYLGFPVTWPDGEIFGTICVLDNKKNHYGEVYQRLLLQFRDVLQADLNSFVKLAGELRERANLLNLTHDAIFVRDMNGVIKYWNRGAEELYGWTAEQAAGKLIRHLLKTAFPVPLDQIEAEILRAGRWEGELVHTKKDGTQIVVASRWSLQRDERAAPVAILVTNNDITERKRAEQARQDIEDQWRAAFESNPTMYFIVDGAGTTISVNAFGAEQLGYAVSELVGQPVLNVFYEPDRQAVQGYANACFEQPGRMMRWEARKIRKDGTMLWVRETARAAVLKKRPVLLVVCEDITERKRTEQALRRSEAHLAEAQRLSHTGSWAFSPVSGKVLYWSDELFRMWGFDPQQGPPDVQAVLQRIHPEDQERIGQLFERGFEGQLTADVRAEHKIVLPDGTVKYHQGISHPVFDEAGQVIEYVGTAVDVTERKRVEEALRRSEAYLAEAQRLTHTGSWAYDPDGEKAIYWSEETFRIFGLDPRRGSPPDQEEFLRMLHPEDRERFCERVGEAFRSKVDYSVDYRIVLSDGTLKHIHEIGHPVLDETGEVAEWVGTEVDVTDRKRAEAERERLRQLEADLAHMNRVSMMGELAASLAHEIKQPIAAAATNAKTCLRWLQREPPEMGEAREAASRIVKDVNRAADIIDRNRSLYARDMPKPEMVNLNELIREMIVLVNDGANRHSISICAELDRALPTITADRVQMQQVLMNLMLNGIEAMKDTGGELTIRSKKNEDGQILLSVSDVGIGLPVESAERIFDAFFTTKAQGTGMGLSISRRIVESHGGRLWATTNSGCGAIFHLTLPTAVEAHS